MLTFLSVFPIISHNDEAKATPESSTSTITITSTSNIASVDITPTSNLGTFAATDSNSEVVFNVSTTNLSGYNLTLSSAPGDTSGRLTNTTYADTLDSISSATDATTFATGATSTYTNKWGIKPSKLNSAANTDFLAAPTTTAITIDTTSASNSTPNGYTIGLGARVDYEKSTGTYTNSFVLEAVVRPMMYQITYSSGSIADVTGTAPATESNTAAISGVTLANNTLSRTTYTFAGWCDGTINTTTVYDSTNKIYYNPGTLCNDAPATGNSDVYAAASSYKFAGKTINPDGNNDVTLTAVWNPTTVAQAYGSTTMTMQNMSSTICNKITPNQWALVTDNRDSQQYHIARLEDGRCWMLDNLNLDLYTYRNTLSTGNTNITDSTALSRFKGSGTMSSSDRYPTAAITSGWTTNNSNSAPLQNRNGKCDPSINGSYYPCTKAPSGVTNGYQGNNYNYNTVIDRFSSSGSSSAANIYYNIGPGNYKVGTFYNFCATTGGYYCWGNGTDAGSHTESTNYNIANDICPASWRLPKSGTISYPTANYDEYKYLYDTIAANYPETYNTSTSPLSIQSMLSTSLAGFYRSGTAYNQGSGAYYWTSTYVSITDIYYAYSGIITFSSNTPSAHRYDGMSIRCIAQ